jgi:hypothetical protein
MACAGCARRRKKIAAAYHAAIEGFTVARQSYRSQTTEPAEIEKRLIPPPMTARIIDIRE